MNARELEQLQNKKTELEDKSRSLEEEQKELEHQVKVLEEKITVKELENNNKTKEDAINQLRSKIDDLEHRLNEAPEEQEAAQPKYESPSRVNDVFRPREEITPEASVATSEEEPEGETVTVTAADEPSFAEHEEIGDGLQRQYEKKKRKFF